MPAQGFMDYFSMLPPHLDLDIPIRGAQFATDRIAPIRSHLKSHNPKFRSIRCDVFTIFSNV